MDGHTTTIVMAAIATANTYRNLMQKPRDGCQHEIEKEWGKYNFNQKIYLHKCALHKQMVASTNGSSFASASPAV